MLIDSYLFYALIPIVAFFYASVGHGGASGYLALMALFSFPPAMMKQTALLLNLFVAGSAFYHYYRAGHFNKTLFIYFALGSIPAAYFGGSASIDLWLYKKILGFFLFITVLRMLFKNEVEIQDTKKSPVFLALFIGLVIGYFSGLIGIGGGIILTPVILLLRWGSMKTAAAVSALFIWVNSASGLIGQFNSGVLLSSNAFILVSFALIGGLLGSYYGSQRWNNRKLEYFLALVLTSAGIKLILF